MKIGIDVSEHNGKLDWKAIKAAGVEFAILRTGYGSAHTDAQLSANLAGAKAQGLPYGFYHYSYALNESDAQKEAALVARLLKSTAPAHAVWFDMEDADGYKKRNGFTFSKANVTAVCKVFLDAIKAEGFPAGVYASQSWFQDYIDVKTLNCPVWVAQWSSRCTYSGSYALWQYSDSRTLSGCSGSFDGDYWYDGETVKSGMLQNTAAAAGVGRWVLPSGGQPLHKGPSASESSLALLARGAKVTWYGYYCVVNEEKWAYIRAENGTQGYVPALSLGTAPD